VSPETGSGDALTDAIGRIWAASGQRWGLMALAVVAAVGATVATGSAAGHLPIAYVVVVAVLAVVAVIIPDSPVALVTVAVVVVWWLAIVDDVASPWALAGAAGLLVFHLVVALMAVTPPNAIVAAEVLRRWVGNGALVLVATAGVWGAVAVVDGRSVPGSVALVLAALAAVTVGVVTAGVRSGPR